MSIFLAMNEHTPVLPNAPKGHKDCYFRNNKLIKLNQKIAKLSKQRAKLSGAV